MSLPTDAARWELYRYLGTVGICNRTTDAWYQDGHCRHRGRARDCPMRFKARFYHDGPEIRLPAGYIVDSYNVRGTSHHVKGVVANVPEVRA